MCTCVYVHTHTYRYIHCNRFQSSLGLAIRVRNYGMSICIYPRLERKAQRIVRTRGYLRSPQRNWAPQCPCPILRCFQSILALLSWRGCIHIRYVYMCIYIYIHTLTCRYKYCCRFLIGSGPGCLYLRLCICKYTDVHIDGMYMCMYMYVHTNCVYVYVYTYVGRFSFGS